MSPHPAGPHLQSSNAEGRWLEDDFRVCMKTEELLEEVNLRERASDVLQGIGLYPLLQGEP